jgi:hypothetical protein
MTKGTALFDAVAISGTRVTVRAGQCGDAQLGRVSADGVRRPISTGGAALACAQGGSGGVVRMEDGAVLFKGGSISNSTAVRACAQRESRVRAAWYGMLRGAARPMDGAHGARCGEWCAVYGACGRRGACCIGCIIIVASMRVASVLRRALPRCALHVASVRVACCIGACCTLHVANAQPSRSARSCSPLCGVWCACAARSGEGRAVAVTERGRDALVCSPTTAACSPWTRAPRCSTPWRYPAPKQRCVRASAAMRSWGGCRRTGCIGRLQQACYAGLCAGVRRRRRCVAHGRGGRHVQGRLDLEQHGGACVRRARVARPARRGMVSCAVRHGRWMARKAHAAASGVRCTAHAAGVERAV